MENARTPQQNVYLKAEKQKRAPLDPSSKAEDVPVPPVDLFFRTYVKQRSEYALATYLTALATKSKKDTLSSLPSTTFTNRDRDTQGNLCLTFPQDRIDPYLNPSAHQYTKFKNAYTHTQKSRERLEAAKVFNALRWYQTLYPKTLAKAYYYFWQKD